MEACIENRVKNKRVDIVTIKMVKEGSVLYKGRRIDSPSDAVGIARDFLDDCDREQLIVCCLNTKNEPTAINIVSIGSINSSIVAPREVFKPAYYQILHQLLYFIIIQVETHYQVRKTLILLKGFMSVVNCLDWI